MGNIVYSLIWLLLLIFIAFWLAFLCAGIYIIVYCFRACFDFLEPICDVLLQGVQMPYFCAKGMMEGKPLF